MPTQLAHLFSRGAGWNGGQWSGYLDNQKLVDRSEGDLISDKMPYRDYRIARQSARSTLDIDQREEFVIHPDDRSPAISVLTLKEKTFEHFE
jgi:hypothetical protein